MSLFSFIHVFLPNFFLSLSDSIFVFWLLHLYIYVLFLLFTKRKEDDFVSFNCHRIQCALAGIGSL
jgi:hypothetical protein